jgi:hypothetical protein
MAIHKTPEMLGQQPVPAIHEAGDSHSITFKWDFAATNVANGDFIQLMQVPDEAVLDDIRIGATATLGSTTLAVGIADAAATTALSTTYVAAAAHTTTAVRRADATIMGDAVSHAATSNQRIVTVAVAGANIATAVMYVTVYYRASRYGN